MTRSDHQSGSDRILKAMNRPYSRDRYKQIVDDLRRVRPDMYFSTDVIVGFPGETDEDFAQTRELFEACNYDMAFVFRYSIRSGTPGKTSSINSRFGRSITVSADAMMNASAP